MGVRWRRVEGGGLRWCGKMSGRYMPTSVQSGKFPMECRKLRDCRPANAKAKWKDDNPAEPWELPEWVTRNVVPEKQMGEGLVFVNIPGSLKEATTQEALQRGVVLAITWKDRMCNAEDVFDITRHYADIKKGKNCKLATVHLQNCFLGVGGGKTIAKTLPFVSTLFLQGNAVRDEGVRTIAVALEANDKVHTMGLVDECIGPVGARYIAKALQVNQCLEHLDLSGNDLTEDGVREICFALQRNPGTILQTLKLDPCFGGIAKGEYQGLLRSFKMLFTVSPYEPSALDNILAQKDDTRTHEAPSSPTQQQFSPTSPQKPGSAQNRSRMGWHLIVCGLRL